MSKDRRRSSAKLLSPVDPGETPTLSDRDATFRGELPEKGVKEATARLLERAADLQGALQAERRQALLVVLQARDAGGKDGTIKKVFGALNPVAMQVTSFKAPSVEELAHDFLWRVHRAVPAKGMVGIFNRSHYEDVLVPRVDRLVPPSVWEQRFDQINGFERSLAETGTTILKIFLHVSREEQRRRLQARIDEPRKHWKAADGDWAHRKRWTTFTRAYRDLLTRCTQPWAPWFVVPGDDKKVRNWLVADLVVRTLERMAPRYPRAVREPKDSTDKV